MGNGRLIWEFLINATLTHFKNNTANVKLVKVKALIVPMEQIDAIASLSMFSSEATLVSIGTN